MPISQRDAQRELEEAKWLMKAIALLCRGTRGGLVSYVLTKLLVAQNRADGLNDADMHEMMSMVQKEEIANGH